MPEDQKIARAQLVEIEFDEDRGSYKKEDGLEVEVQFNPQSLKVNYKNQKSGDDQQGTAGVQFVGKGSTSLSVDLLFDATRPTGQDSDPKDVRELTDEVNQFMRNLEKKEDGKYAPPAVRFVWGSFLFEGVMGSMSETLDFFDHEGRPLRATVSVSLSKNEIQFERPENGPRSSANGDGQSGNGQEDPEGRSSSAENRNTTSVQQEAAKQGKLDEWKEGARKNGIENPRDITNPNALAF